MFLTKFYSSTPRTFADATCLQKRLVHTYLIINKIAHKPHFPLKLSSISGMVGVERLLHHERLSMVINWLDFDLKATEEEMRFYLGQFLKAKQR